jgi:hypothetical protein
MLDFIFSKCHLKSFMRHVFIKFLFFFSILIFLTFHARFELTTAGRLCLTKKICKCRIFIVFLFVSHSQQFTICSRSLLQRHQIASSFWQRLYVHIQLRKGNYGREFPHLYSDGISSKDFFLFESLWKVSDFLFEFCHC